MFPSAISYLCQSICIDINTDYRYRIIVIIKLWKPTAWSNISTGYCSMRIRSKQFSKGQFRKTIFALIAINDHIAFDIIAVWFFFSLWC